MNRVDFVICPWGGACGYVAPVPNQAGMHQQEHRNVSSKWHEMWNGFWNLKRGGHYKLKPHIFWADTELSRGFLLMAGQTGWQPSLRLAPSLPCFMSKRSSPWWTGKTASSSILKVKVYKMVEPKTDNVLGKRCHQPQAGDCESVAEKSICVISWNHSQ